MKPLLFRAWDKRSNRMFLVREMYWLVGGLQVDDGATTPRGFVPKDFDIMQYTGLNDRNGTEIYEGDIIKDLEISPSLNNIRVIRNFIEDGFWLKEQIYDINRTRNPIEVIGNIYENAELLEEEE
ncbi:MAG: hypothetical protein JW924_03125 [Fusobacteriaceae bacterium]|nr:hypothetical protein [Fusobacteriaceae bacterium]